MEILIKLFCYKEKVSTHMNTWIVGKDLMHYDCLIKNLFIAT